MQPQKQLSKDQVRVILNNAPANLDKTKIVKSLVDQGYQLEGFGEPQQTETKKPLFDLSGKGNTLVNDTIKEQGSKVADIMSDPTKNAVQKGFGATAAAFNTIPKVAYDIAPKPVQKVLDTTGKIVEKGFDKTVNAISDTSLFQDAAMSGETGQLEKGLDVASSAGQVAGDILAVEGASKTIKNTINNTPKVVKAIEDTAKKLTVQSEKQLESALLNNYSKGVKPTIAGKTSLAKDSAYKSNVIEARNVIKENTPNLSFTDDLGEVITGTTPKTLQQFAESIDQTKKSIFNKYDSLAKEAGDAGVGVEMNPIASELDTVINNKALSITNPTAIKYAENLKERLQSTGAIDAQTAQDVIQNYNKSLEAFYKNPSYENASQAAIDSMVANKMRLSLDEGISGLTGKQYGALKKQYGALKSIENDVVKAALRDARKNTKGLIDYTDIFSGGQVVSGILSLNPGQIASGITQKALAAFYKHLNNPNRAIEAFFKD